MKYTPAGNPFWTFALWIGRRVNRLPDWPQRRRVRRRFPGISDEGVTKRLELEASSLRTAQRMVDVLNFFGTREELQWDVEIERLRFPPGYGPVSKRAQKLFDEYLAEKKRRSTMRFRLRKLFNQAAGCTGWWRRRIRALACRQPRAESLDPHSTQEAKIQRFKNRVEQAIRAGTVRRETQKPKPSESRKP